MKITVDGKTYDHDANRLPVSEAILLGQLTGMTFKAWQTGLAEMDPVALKGLVYLIKLRAGERPDWASLDFDIASLEVADDEVPTGADEAA